MVTESSITEFKDALLAKLESAGLALNDVGNGDEWMFEIIRWCKRRRWGPESTQTQSDHHM